ncbi:rhomboid family intramembrane serine protease [Halopenitus sp. H-Gu1]|uniref:rhomboid family intramembrane serine protease n=1 Tax=Halopenitus sp. H-Gu1 TaxID=3242697 RepID=UPI00359E0B30
MIPDWLPLHRLVIPIAFCLAFAVIVAVDRPRGSWGRKLRSRLLLGVPWGTIIAVGIVICVYLFVQRGIDDPTDPVVIPFRAWSYVYPEGMVLSGLSHASLNHVVGNLLATLVVGSLAEYAYGHFPRRRGAISFRTLGENPVFRAFLVVPVAMIGGAIIASMFSIGPVIGFSGVVFALWGFTLVQYPLGSIVALAGASLLNVLYRAFRNPVVEASANPSYGGPWWANISIQGHAIGLILGVLIGAVLVRRRERHAATRGSIEREKWTRRPAIVVFTGVLLFASSRSLWAVYWFLGNERYVLYRAIGVGLIVLLALIVALAAAGGRDPIVPSWAVPNPETFREAVRSASPRTIGIVLLLFGFGVLAGPSIAPNLSTVSDEELPGDPIEVEGYEVTYAEDVPNQMVNVIDIEAFDRTTRVNTSGVIVKNADRGIWITAVSRGNLKYWGSRSVEIGGPGWRETIIAHRTGWKAIGTGTAYRVDLEHAGDRRTAFRSDPVEAEPTIEGRTVSVAAVEGGFEVSVTRGNRTNSRTSTESRTETAPLPAENESVELQGLTLTREERRIYAESNDTRVRVLERERYEGRERS